MNIIHIDINLAKQVFQIYYVDAQQDALSEVHYTKTLKTVYRSLLVTSN